MKKYHSLVFISCYLIAIFCAFAEQNPIPILKHRVNDLTHTLNAQQFGDLEQQIIQFEKHHSDGCQLAVLIVANLSKSTTIEEQANKIFNYWQLGKKGKDNGILLFISLYDRELRIEVGYGLEGLLTDLRTKHIIDNIIIPHFKNEEYAKGILAGIRAIDSILTDSTNNQLSHLENIAHLYDEIIIYCIVAAIDVLIVLIGLYIVKPTTYVRSWFYRSISILLLVIIIMWFYVESFYQLSFSESLKFMSLYTIVVILFSLMFYVILTVLQLTLVIPCINKFYNQINKQHNSTLTDSIVTTSMPTNQTKQINRVKPFELLPICITLLLIGIFTLLPPIMKFWILLIYFIYVFVIAFKHQGKNSRFGHGGGGRGGNRFSGGGGRSGGGGASGRW